MRLGLSLRLQAETSGTASTPTTRTKAWRAFQSGKVMTTQFHG